MRTLFQLDSYSTATSSITDRPIYINESPDMFLVSPDINYDEVEKVASWWLGRCAKIRPSHRPTPGQRKAVEELRFNESREEICEKLNHLLLDEFDSLRKTNTALLKQNYLVELMLRLWSSGAVAWPTATRGPFKTPKLDLNNLGFDQAALNFLKKIIIYLDESIGNSPTNFLFILDQLLSRAGLKEIGDITPATFYITPEHTRTGKLRAPGMFAILSALRVEHYKYSIGWSAEDFGFFKTKMGRLARDEKFNWLTSTDPRMADWANLAIEHLASHPANFKTRRSSIHVFLQHFLDHPELPRNPVEYFDVRRKPNIIFDVPGNAGRKIMTIVHEFLDETIVKICSESDDNEIPILMPGFANPIAKRRYRNVNAAETHREAMPTRLISLAVHILTENDFSWAKRIGIKNDTFRWLDAESGEVETVWSPVRAYAILLKLLLPARSFQIRMLDSGEADTYRYTVEGTWKKNCGKHRPLNDDKLVEEGVFRRYSRRDGNVGSVIFFNTNKTSDIDSEVKGFVMPWEHKEALRLMAQLRDWQEKYNPVKSPTPWTEIVELKKVKHIEDLEKNGASFFLFRDPANGNRPDLPLTDPRLRNLWLKLMEEMENRLAKSGETLSNGQPIKLIIGNEKKSGQPSAAVFDLHSLRVSIITALYEEGVPPEYLMKVVGHATVLMTLYYTKINAEALSRRLDDAAIERQRKSQAEMAGFISQASFAELEKVVAFHHPSALEAAVAATGVGLLVMDHGICTTCAKRCHEGLAIFDPATSSTKYQAVPGGASNCVRCRFFITGPAFLFGLEAHVTDLFYRLKKASTIFENSQNKFDILADKQAEDLSAGRSFMKQREIEIAEAALEASTNEVDSIAKSLNAAYRLTEQCVYLAKNGGGTELTLVAAGGIEEIEAVLSEGCEFDQLNRICMAATLFDGLKIDWLQPNLERARLFDRMLRNSGLEPRFYILDDESALHVANAMGKFLYARMPADTVHALMEGKTTLQALGLDRAFIKELKNLEPRKPAGVQLLQAKKS